jgi:hypothetical protein
MEHWVGHIRGTGYTTYGALGRPHMKHWVGHIRGTGYTTYEALDRYTTYEALGGQWGWFRNQRYSVV